jgi:hypothetical protein
MQRFKALSPGPKLVLVAAPLLFFSLFFTWQKLEVDFGPAGSAVRLLDGWDAWGLLIGLGALALATLAVLLHLTDVEMSEDVPWERIMLAGGLGLLALTLLKVLTDADSAWAGYVGVVLAAALALGTYESWAEWAGRHSLLARIRRRGGVSRAA